jgi:ribonuclease J
MLSEEGLVVVVATINMQKHTVLAGPDLLSRGFVYMRESGELINSAQRRVYRTIKRTFASNEKVSEAMLKDAITSSLSDFLFERTERKPIVIPMLITL